jgi:hypothetical protein
MVFSQAPGSDYNLPSQSELGVAILHVKVRMVSYLGGIRTAGPMHDLVQLTGSEINQKPLVYSFFLGVMKQ